ncbi:flagella assembly protein FlgT middle domain-containing protein [Granulosicoccus antarcticus]|uniref:Flagellar assembly protein T middle domain-containing protein n=1 Tax=Granulosicoccus antarcticus IMCC3135 TaxID=1192854 RepID=A0A2Z2NX69_9GAMM|nr:flagella assembly protein FlgT middle domain-containing protein [Granulosicoccus antarcticus]ASJ75939.1 hypothetical protein IMCC3135_29445 [Granulosicoccus antarcticus IMCC3135]
MTVTFHKLSIVAAVMVLLAGCSLKGEPSVAEQWEAQQQQSEEQAKADKTDSQKLCSPEPGSPFSYRKAILVAGTIGVPDLARDLPGLADLTSRRLQTHLDALGRFNVFATHDSSFESIAPTTAVRVRQLGRDNASQFVVKLELEDMTMTPGGNWFDKLLGASDERNVLIKLFIYDVEYGSLFYSQRYQRTVEGDVVGFPGNGRTVATPWFSTDLGEVVDEILKAISLQINQKLACVPFSAEVTAIKGKDIHINAGFLHGIRTGEALRIYRRSDVLVPDEIQKQGDDEGWITVHTVFPNHSIASVAQGTQNRRRLEISDVVRAW